MPYEIRYAEEAVSDVDGLRAYDQRNVVDAIELHLAHQPTLVRGSRIKRMTQPFWSQYRLRVDDFRVYYDVDEASRQVNVLRILAKGTGTTPEQAP